jgi:hypothetical protein
MKTKLISGAAAEQGTDPLAAVPDDTPLFIAVCFLIRELVTRFADLERPDRAYMMRLGWLTAGGAAGWTSGRCPANTSCPL